MNIWVRRAVPGRPGVESRNGPARVTSATAPAKTGSMAPISRMMVFWLPNHAVA